jgi:hypothetical protein
MNFTLIYVLTGSDVIFPCFFLTIVVVQNVPLRMTEMATGSNVTPKGISLVSGAIFALVGSFGD